MYSAREIAGDDAWGQISRVADACVHKESPIKAVTERGRWFDSVRSALNAIPLDSPGAKFQIKACILLNHMISFHNFNRQRVSGTDEEIARLYRLPNEVAKRFFQLFATEMPSGTAPSYAISKSQRAKCCLYTLILFVIAHGRSMKIGSIKPVVDDLKMEMNQATNFLRGAGFTIKKAGGKVSVSLSIPLTFPAASRGGRRS